MIFIWISWILCSGFYAASLYEKVYITLLDLLHATLVLKASAGTNTNEKQREMNNIRYRNEEFRLLFCNFFIHCTSFIVSSIFFNIYLLCSFCIYYISNSLEMHFNYILSYLQITLIPFALFGYREILQMYIYSLCFLYCRPLLFFVFKTDLLSIN